MINLYLLDEAYTNGFIYNSLNIISVFAVICGIFVIVSKNPVISVLFLIGLFFSIASYLMVLGLNFIGLSYLLVYVGAVSILFLFILMLINVRISELLTDNNNSLILAFLIGISIFVPIYNEGNVTKSQSLFIYDNAYGINDTISFAYANHGGIKLYESFNDTDTLLVTSKIWDGIINETSHITTIGAVIYTNYPLWLIITSIILLLAMVGAIIITIKQ